MDPIVLVLVALLVVLVSTFVMNALVYLVWKPHSTARCFRRQGVAGPEYKFLVGSMPEMKLMKAAGAEKVLDVHSHDFIPLIQPHFQKWVSIYGKTFLYWFGARPAICVADLELVQQVLGEKTGLFPKNSINNNLKDLLGKGLILINGDEWKRHRKVVNPAFNLDKLKAMTTIMSECAQSMMQGWQAQIQQAERHEAEIEMSSEFSELTADVISHSAFGSSYKEGKEVFMALRGLQELAFSATSEVPIPGFRYIPTRKNLQAWKLDGKVKSMCMQIIKSRLASKDTEGYGSDLLGLMLEACAAEYEGNQKLSIREIIDECKTFFFAGHDTTSRLLTWTMFLLSMNTEWQQKLREEVLRECGNEVPNGDVINKMKMVNMVLLETLRLYTPIVFIERVAGTDIELGNIKVMKGTILYIPIAILHRDKDVWGSDANEFNPARFENGISKAAKYPNALLSFSLGPRVCIGQNFAMIEAKIVLAMILHRFSFELSPKYVHAPKEAITLRPKFGLPIIFKSIDK